MVRIQGVSVTDNMENNAASGTIINPLFTETGSNSAYKNEDEGDDLITPSSPLIDFDQTDRFNSHSNNLNKAWKKTKDNKESHEDKEDDVSDDYSKPGKSRQNLVNPEDRFPENLQKFRTLTSLDDIKSFRLWKAVMAEFVGTFILVLVGCGSCIQSWPSNGSISLNDTKVDLPIEHFDADIVQIALAFGLSVSTVVWILGHVSGGHINPAVTCATVITRRVSVVRAVLYIIAQLIGAVTGAVVLKAVTPNEMQGTLGCTLLDKHVNDVMGILLEFLITFVLVLTVFAASDKQRKDLGGSFPLTIGLSVTMCHLFAVRYTGSSMNTARSFGPALVMGLWSDHWVYWLGPIFGGISAGLLYDNIFAGNASLAKCRAFLLTSQFENEGDPTRKRRLKILEEEDI
ncbi:hypothetical protein CHS0354_023402 [Potamilus streckersoni]|uniref:Aquaporin n=1 Tax=Potamilus streckersoni TaxID=2493646 RepID=A0AAE0W9F6_9BIVA|nr:hypothetical protein CHS0354_023402 [Potamilus streckersoni]